MDFQPRPEFDGRTGIAAIPTVHDFVTGVVFDSGIRQKKPCLRKAWLDW
jgi:hypothetical protein